MARHRRWPCPSGRSGCGHTELVDTNDGAVRGRVWRDSKVVDEDFDFTRISDYLNEQDSLTWVDLCDPDHRILQDLAEELTLQPLAVEDAIAQSERAKATRYATHTFITVYAVKLDATPADHNPVEHRGHVVTTNPSERYRRSDAGTAAQRRRRLGAIGESRTRRDHE